MFDVEKVIGEWVEMWMQYDLSKIDELFLESDDLTYYSSEKQRVMKGLEAVKEHHRGYGFVPGGKKHGNKIWAENLEATPIDNVVAVTGIWHYRQVMGAHQWGSFSFVYVNKDDRFLLAHLHFGRYPDNPPDKA